jgi:ATP-dependent Clp protease ATP-binding subunit ClpC
MNDRDRFDKFTGRARRVLSLAQEEAQRFQHNYIGTEHLLLGLVREEEGVAAKVLRKLGVELYKVREAVEFIIGRGDRIVLGEIGLTPRAKKVIELAVDEARRMNHHYIGTEHLLLGLVREGEGIAAGVLESLGVNLEKVRIATLSVLGSSSSPMQASPRPAPPAPQEAEALVVDDDENALLSHNRPPVPEQAAALVAEDEPSLTCSYCYARCPGYFSYCFNCGNKLAQG